MTKAKARARAKARAVAKAGRPKQVKGAKLEPHVRAEQPGANKGANRAFGGQQNIKSAARSGRGAARSR